MPNLACQPERACAIDAVRKASRLCQRVQTTLLSEETTAKDDESPVTVADFGAQALINLALAEQFPGDAIVAEEDAEFLRSKNGRKLRERMLGYVAEFDPAHTEDEVLDAIDRGSHDGGSKGRFWVLDPIDGTKGFLRGDQYAVALALVVDGHVVLGVLGCPNLPLHPEDPESPKGTLYIAVRDQGAVVQTLGSADEFPVHVTGQTQPSEARFCESVEAAHSSHSDAARVARKLGVTRPSYRIDSQCKYAVVASGVASIYLRLPSRSGYEHKIWDHAAGCIVVEEAGGRVSGVNGEPLDFSVGRTLKRNKGMVVTNGRLHEQTVSAVVQVLGR